MKRTDNPRRGLRVPIWVGTVLLAGLLLYGWLSWRNAQREQVLHMQTVAELTERATDRYFSQMQLALGDLAEELVGRDGTLDLPKAQALLRSFKLRHGELVSANLVGRDGRFVATSAAVSTTQLPTLQDQRNFDDIVARLKVEEPMELAQPLVGPMQQRWILPMRYTVRSPGGQVLGFIIAAAPVEMLQTFWSQAPVVAQASVALVRDDGYLLSRYPVPAGTLQADVYGKPRVGAVFQHIRRHQGPAQGYVEGPTTFSADTSASVFKRLQHFPVTLVVSMPVAGIAASWWAQTRGPFLIAGLLALAWLAALWQMHRRDLAWEGERQQTLEQLRASEALLERTGAVAKVGGWAIELGTHQVSWSLQTRRIHEVDEQFVPTEETGISFFSGTARAEITAAVAAGRATGQPWDLELPFTTARGRELWVRAKGAVEFEQGRAVRLLGTIQDVTEDRQRRLQLQEEQQLRGQAEQHAQALDKLLREREEMLDVLAHEVRQPLHNASAALQDATSTLHAVQDADTRQSLLRAKAVVTQVLASIDNTLAVAALLASPQALRREDTDVDLLIGLAIGDMPAGQRPRVHVERHTSTRTAAMDLGLMRLALRNLLANALQHSGAETAVTVRVADSDDPLALLIDVADHGVGIEAALLPRLFERGTRGSQARQQPGHGLGLYIVQRVTALHGGSVQVVANDPGQGLTMRLVVNQSEPP